MITNPSNFIFSADKNFTEKAIALFRFQYEHNALYQRFVDSLNCKADAINTIEKIPFLPISFFKTHTVSTTDFSPVVVFESSGTTGSVNSKHLVKNVSLYEESFRKGFEQFYGPIKDYCILGLLPSYLERKGSSLVYMVEKMMQISTHPLNGFHLYDFKNLADKLLQLQAENQKTLLIGVTYALLDFAEAFPMPLENVLIMETGGMKGRKKELLREEVHQILKHAFSLTEIHSEYGMTELLSQAYAKSGGRFKTPNWMKIVLREEDDPFRIITHTDKPVTGAINVIDLANMYSCSFIETQDVGRLHADGSFEVLGRMDNSDIRGCSLMAV